MKIYPENGETMIDLAGAALLCVSALDANSCGLASPAVVTGFQNGFPRLPHSGARVNIAGLGDVGGLFATGLRLLGGGLISKIGLYDPNEALARRYELELSEVLPASMDAPPEVFACKKEDLFDCDVFCFTASRGVPAIGAEKGSDVRMAQFASNCEILAPYAEASRGFSGLFAVISDPVDLLCKFVRASAPNLDPFQIRGFGLGVMYARAAHYGALSGLCPDFIRTGRAYGPHGEGLVIANDTGADYDHARSVELTRLVREANLRVRALGYKPYIAPALSSAAISLVRLLSGQWHESALPIGNVYFGCRSRVRSGRPEIEALPLADALLARLNETYALLEASPCRP